MIGALAGWLVGVALAQDPRGRSALDPLAERTRLEDELVKLAQRNTWTGVERTYQRLVDLEVPLPPQDAYLAARAALARGDTLLGWFRLRRARNGEPGVDTIQLEATEAAAHEMEAIEGQYGLVSIFVGEGAVPVLLREVMPFAQQERDAIVAAQGTIRETGAFRGLLPVGSYAIDAVKFDVAAGMTWMSVTAGN